MRIEQTSSDQKREAHIRELCHRMTTCDARDARVMLCRELTREIEQLNADRLARLNDALELVTH